MEYPACVQYVRENLGIDLVGHEHGLSPEQIRMVVERFPFRGILLSTGSNHLIKAGVICSSLLSSDKITGCIGRFESWEQAIIDHSTSFLLYTNLSEDLVKPQFVASTVRFCMQMSIPMLFTTPLTIDGLDSALPISVLSNIVPYLYGKL